MDLGIAGKRALILGASQGLGAAIVVVDPGDADVVERYLHAGGAPLVAILITHHHPDHIGGVARLAHSWPDAERIGPEDARIPGLTRTVDDGELVDIGDGMALRVIAVPGHTRSHVAYFGFGSLFCGDVLFSLGCGRVFEGDAGQMHASLQRIAALPDATQVYCAHEYTLANARFALTVDADNQDLQQRADSVRALREQGRSSVPTDLGSERRCNPFLRCATQAVRASASAHAGRILHGEVEVFAELREWKNRC